MKENIINNLTVLINEKNYDDDKVYVTFGIKFGFAISKVIIIHKQEEVEVNSASGNLFANYMKLYLKKMFKIYVKTNINDNMMYLSFQGKSENLDNTIEKVIKSIYELEVNEELFLEAKLMTVNNFKESYKNPEFRAYYKTLEFVHMHKNFDFIKLIRDIENIDIEHFTWFNDNMICFANSILFINGNVKFLEESTLHNVIKSIKHEDIEVVQASRMIDSYLTSDRCVVAGNGYDVKIGSIKFEFLNPYLNMLDRQVLLSIISTIMFKRKSQVLVDEFDSSIVYFNSELKPYKESILKYVTEENVIKAKEYILNLSANFYEYNPYVFNERYVEFYAKGINMTEYLKAIEECKEETINEVYTLGDIKIIEGQVMYKEDK